MEKINRDVIEKSFTDEGYITDQASLTALQLVIALKRPLLIEGPAGVGKTELAKVLARVLNTRFIRLQCYEGLDVHNSLYEWNYQKQMLYIKLAEQKGTSIEEQEKHIFSDEFLFKRPLLEAISDGNEAPVLLIDEIDRADEEFEAFLLELLGENQITIPELGTIKAKHNPYIILTSNRTRELSDALRRRCLYQWIPYPDFQKEKAILEARLPDINKDLSGQIAKMMETFRNMPLNKIPGIAESLDWAKALMLLHRGFIDREILIDTLGCIIKDQDDWQLVQSLLDKDPLILKKAEAYSRSFANE